MIEIEVVEQFLKAYEGWILTPNTRKHILQDLKDIEYNRELIKKAFNADKKQ